VPTIGHTYQNGIADSEFPFWIKPDQLFKNKKPKITTEKPEITRAAYRSCISVFQKLITDDMRADLPPKTSGTNIVQEYYKYTPHARN
jgi:hypothetical protein